jgi:hypothetical protein
MKNTIHETNRKHQQPVDQVEETSVTFKDGLLKINRREKKNEKE